jgi:hypothetical protein
MASSLYPGLYPLLFRAGWSAMHNERDKWFLGLPPYKPFLGLPSSCSLFAGQFLCSPATHPQQ